MPKNSSENFTEFLTQKIVDNNLSNGTIILIWYIMQWCMHCLISIYNTLKRRLFPMAKMMDALVKPEKGPGLVLTKVPVPTPGPGEVLIKIRKTAICGTDVHIYEWNGWAEKNIVPPITIGHEYIGEIAELGEGVTNFKVGQKVSGEGHLVCGHCYNCRTGNSHWCKATKGVGVNRNGAFAEYLCIPATNVIEIEDDLDEEVVSFFDAFGNATHTALYWDLVGKNVLITGAGPIGIMAAAICKFAGARTVVITDVNEYRLDLALKIGATRAVNVSKDRLGYVMHELGIKEGFDIGLEMSGSEAALNDMIHRMVNGGRIALLGLQGNTANVDLERVIFNGITMKGIYGRKVWNTWIKMTMMLQAGLDIKNIITHRIDARDYEEGFETMISGQSGKVVMDWSHVKEQ